MDQMSTFEASYSSKLLSNSSGAIYLSDPMSNSLGLVTILFVVDNPQSEILIDQS